MTDKSQMPEIKTMPCEKCGQPMQGLQPAGETLLSMQHISPSCADLVTRPAQDGDAALEAYKVLTPNMECEIKGAEGTEAEEMQRLWDVIGAALSRTAAPQAQEVGVNQQLLEALKMVNRLIEYGDGDAILKGSAAHNIIIQAIAAAQPANEGRKG